MDKNDIYWYSIWKLIAITFCVTVVSMTGCTMNNKRVLNEMVKNGASPMEARCAIGVDTESQTVLCAIVAGNK